ncbi:3'-5' exonuclease [Paenibacillus sp. TRM 82003]|nr:3'-5' exonuclease [Paenibacillus sp. TRM 82003]
MLLDNITVLDFETSGLRPDADRVIEISAIRCFRGEVVSSFTTLVHFTGPLPAKITELTGITSDQLAGGMDEGTAFRILNRMIGDNLIVAHNALFDLSFLHHTLLRLAGRSFHNSFIDTLTVCRERHVYPHTLKDMCAKYDIPLDNAHRAEFDVLATFELLKRLNEEQSVESQINKLGFLKKFGPPKWAPAHAAVEAIELKYA